jgi:hypothetical protein
MVRAEQKLTVHLPVLGDALDAPVFVRRIHPR